MDPFELFYLATLGGAQTLHIDRYVGNFAQGKEADFVVLDAGGKLLMQQRLANIGSLSELLFAYIIFGGPSSVRETWSMGQRVYQRSIY